MFSKTIWHRRPDFWAENLDQHSQGKKRRRIGSRAKNRRICRAKLFLGRNTVFFANHFFSWLYLTQQLAKREEWEEGGLHKQWCTLLCAPVLFLFLRVFTQKFKNSALSSRRRKRGKKIKTRNTFVFLTIFCFVSDKNNFRKRIPP